MICTPVLGHGSGGRTRSSVAIACEASYAKEIDEGPSFEGHGGETVGTLGDREGDAPFDV